MKTIVAAISALVLASGPLLSAGKAGLGELRVHDLGDRRVIVEQVAGVVLPDPPRPVAREAAAGELAAEDEDRDQEELAREAMRWHPAVHAGAAVFRGPDGRVLTQVTHWRVNNGPPVSFWSSADFGLLAHPGEFATEDGVQLRVSRLGAEEAAAWHRHATDRKEGRE